MKQAEYFFKSGYCYFIKNDFDKADTLSVSQGYRHQIFSLACLYYFRISTILKRIIKLPLMVF